MPYTIVLKPSERTFTAEADEPILSAAIRQSIAMPYGCRDGACGSCKSVLLAGRVVHGAHSHKALSDEEEARGLILPCCAVAQGDCTIEARTVPGLGVYPIVKIPTRVITLERPAPDVTIVRLQLPANIAFKYRAGQYIEFLLKDGVRRSYSMATAPANVGSPPAVDLHIRHMPGGVFTDHVFGTMKEKEILRAEGPFGSFFLREGSKPIVLLASGTGFAPIKAIVEQMEVDGDTRPAVLYWGCRARRDLYLHEWAEAAAARLSNLRYIPVLSEPASDDDWRGRLGFVHKAVLTDLPDLSGHQVYACGAPVMVEAAQREFVEAAGLPADAFFADSFTSAADKP